jgi:hypothetical protein
MGSQKSGCHVWTDSIIRTKVAARFRNNQRKADEFCVFFWTNGLRLSTPDHKWNYANHIGILLHLHLKSNWNVSHRIIISSWKVNFQLHRKQGNKSAWWWDFRELQNRYWAKGLFRRIGNLICSNWDLCLGWIMRVWQWDNWWLSLELFSDFILVLQR